MILLDILWKVIDYGPRFFDYLKNLINIKIFLIGLAVITFIESLMNLNFLQKNILNFLSPDFFPIEPGYTTTFLWYPFGSVVPLIIIVLILSAIINQKLFIYIVNRKYFFQFYDSLDHQIDNNEDFKDVWNKYRQICEIVDMNYRYLNTKSHDDGITLIFRRLHSYFHLKSKQRRRNINTSVWNDDYEYQHKILLYNFIQKICEFEAQYTPENHVDIKEEFITKPLKQIQLEDELIHIIECCHIDGKGFLSTLALENLIAISLSLPHEKRLKILKILKTVETRNIGWLNRRLFEVILVNVALNYLSDNEWNNLSQEVKKVDTAILAIEPKLTFDERIEQIKDDFRENALKKYLSEEGLKYV